MDSKGKQIVRDDDATNSVDSGLWQACAGELFHIPSVNSMAFYFVQGHFEHAIGTVDLRNYPQIPPYILCKVESIDYLADHDTDDVYAKIRLLPVCGSKIAVFDKDAAGVLGSEEQDKKTGKFAKTLTQSDANNGGGFSVPRYCAETIFPPLDHSAADRHVQNITAKDVHPVQYVTAKDDHPVQNITAKDVHPVQYITAKDVHGKRWTFRHIYRGTPRRHLLTTGWSIFVNAKKLVAGDSIVFLKDENNDLCVGIRRGRRVLGGRHELSSGWPLSDAVMQQDEESKMMRNSLNSGVFATNVSLNSDGIATNGKVSSESVMEAATLAAMGQPFEVVYYPRAGTPEFVVKAARVYAAMQTQWRPGMKIKMPFETEDSSQVSWFVGNISDVQVVDPVHWPNSPWRLLQVVWDEPGLLQYVKRVSPWLVKLIPDMPLISLSPSSPPGKKFRFVQRPDTPADGQKPMPPGPSNHHEPSNPLGCLANNFPAGMQGARHAQFGVSLLDTNMNKLEMDLFPEGLPVLDAAFIRPNKRPTNSMTVQSHNSSSCGESVSQAQKKSDESGSHQFILFGQPIVLTEEHMSFNCSGDSVSPKRTENGSSAANVDYPANNSGDSGSALNQHGQQKHSSTDSLQLDKENPQEIVFNLGSGLCKVFMEPEVAGRALDLSLLNSYEELCSNLANMYGIEGSEILEHLVYQDAAGSVKTAGAEPFSEFARRAKKLTILIKYSSNNVGA